MGHMYDVVVIGAGIAGLTAAYELRDSGRVLVLEAGGDVGGKLRTSLVGELAVDEGAEQVLVRSPEAVELIRAVGLGDDLVHPRTSSAWVWSRGRLRPLPTGTVVGVPADPVSVARSRVLSAAGLARASADAVLPRTDVDGDVAVGRYVAARVGREVVERLVDPLLGGVYAGRADDLSLRATLPQLAPHVTAHRSLLGAARAARAAGAGATGPVFAGLAGGLGRLPHAVVDVLSTAGIEVRTRSTVRALATTPSGFRLTVGPVSREEHIDARSVVVAVPATPAGRLLRHVAPSAAAATAGIEYASVAIVTLAYRDQVALSGSGFLVPAVEARTVKAATFLSSKWAHLDGALTLVRASVGRYGEPDDIQREDHDLVAVVRDDLMAITGLAREPSFARVSRWGGGLPQYAPGHLDRVARIRAGLPDAVVVCGAAYDGVGVPACIRSGRTAAATLREWLRERRHDGHDGVQAEGT
jgi:oxygen-dependent protoporphyrinogen oxidase